MVRCWGPGATSADAAASPAPALAHRPPLQPHPPPPRSLTDLFAGDPECARKGEQHKERAGLARTHAFAGAGLDDELELRKLQVGLAGWLLSPAVCLLGLHAWVVP